LAKLGQGLTVPLVEAVKQRAAGRISESPEHVSHGTSMQANACISKQGLDEQIAKPLEPTVDDGGPCMRVP
jgi:hypothetical protein